MGLHDTQKNGRARQPTRLESSEQETRYFELRRNGFTSADARRRMGINVRRADVLASHYHAETTGQSIDATCPRFSFDEDHIAACLAHGGFVAFSERRLPRAQVIICLPIIRPTVHA